MGHQSHPLFSSKRVAASVAPIVPIVLIVFIVSIVSIISIISIIMILSHLLPVLSFRVVFEGVEI